MPRVKPTTVVEAAADEATKKVVGAAGADSIPDAGATNEAEGSPDAGAASVEEVKEEEEEEEEEKEVSFDELVLDEQLKRALRKKGMIMTTPIQREAILLILVRGFLRPFFLFHCSFMRANLDENIWLH
jgi:ATP-dependent RNA helicase DDX56/DBP9